MTDTDIIIVSVLCALFGGGVLFLLGQVAGRFAGFKEGYTSGWLDGYNTALDEYLDEDEDQVPNGAFAFHCEPDCPACEQAEELISDTTILPPKGDV